MIKIMLAVLLLVSALLFVAGQALAPLAVPSIAALVGVFS